jgi:hypothetical protein
MPMKLGIEVEPRDISLYGVCDGDLLIVLPARLADRRTSFVRDCTGLVKNPDIRRTGSIENIINTFQVNPSSSGYNLKRRHNFIFGCLVLKDNIPQFKSERIQPRPLRQFDKLL